MRSLRGAWVLASAVLVWQGCSLNDSGLTADGGPRSDAGTGGVRTDGPVGGAGGIAAGGRGGAGGSASGVAGSGVAGEGGSAGSGSVAGAGGATGGAGGAGAGNVAGAAGSVAGASGAAGGNVAGAAGSVAGAAGSVAGAAGTGIAGTGVAGAGGQGMAGAGGTVGGRGGTAGGIAGVGGGVAGVGGRGGSGGAGGRGGTGGRGGSGGRGGAGGRACAEYPVTARSFVTPTDNRVHCYWPHANMVTWPQARTMCTSEGGHLVTILSEEENLFVVSIALFSPMYSDTWIGATDGKPGTDKNGPGNYSWVTGEVWNFDAWFAQEPDGFCDPCSGQDCTCDHRGTLVSDATWSDRWEGTPRGFVCEATP